MSRSVIHCGLRRQVAGELRAASAWADQIRSDRHRFAHRLGITFALADLYLAHEHGYTGKQVQRAHLLLAKASKSWPLFKQPEGKASVTVCDVLNTPEDQRYEMLREWGRAVWRLWTPEHANNDTSYRRRRQQ